MASLSLNRLIIASTSFEWIYFAAQQSALSSSDWGYSSGRRIMALRKPCEYSCARKKAHASPIFSHNTGLYITAYLSRGNFLTMAMYLKSGSGISQLAWALATPVNITADCKAVSNINFRMMYFIIAPVYVIKM